MSNLSNVLLLGKFNCNGMGLFVFFLSEIRFILCGSCQGLLSDLLHVNWSTILGIYGMNKLNTQLIIMKTNKELEFVELKENNMK